MGERVRTKTFHFLTAENPELRWSSRGIGFTMCNCLQTFGYSVVQAKRPEKIFISNGPSKSIWFYLELLKYQPKWGNRSVDVIGADLSVPFLFFYTKRVMCIHELNVSTNKFVYNATIQNLHLASLVSEKVSVWDVWSLMLFNNTWSQKGHLVLCMTHFFLYLQIIESDTKCKMALTRVIADCHLLSAKLVGECYVFVNLEIQREKRQGFLCMREKSQRKGWLG